MDTDFLLDDPLPFEIRGCEIQDIPQPISGHVQPRRNLNIQRLDLMDSLGFISVHQCSSVVVSSFVFRPANSLGSILEIQGSPYCPPHSVFIRANP